MNRTKKPNSALLNKMRKLIYRYSNGKRVLFLFILTNLVYVIMLAITIPRVMQFANGLKLLDMLPWGYDYVYVTALFKTLGENGRAMYLFNQIPVDMIYPLLYGVSYCLVLAWFLKKLNQLNSMYFYLCLLPLIGGAADYLENIGIILMLNQYPDITTITVKFSNVFSLIKSTSTSVYFLSLIIVMAIVGIKALRNQ